MEHKITVEEYAVITKQLAQYTATRNTLLTFSFTAVLTILGVALGVEEELWPGIYLIPYFLIVPFAARITYYRIADAHATSFLCECAPEKMQFAICSDGVPENFGLAYKLIAVLVNFEMAFLGAATGFVFAIKLWTYQKQWVCWQYALWLLIPFALTGVVIWMSYTAFNYKKIKYSYKWKEETHQRDCA